MDGVDIDRLDAAVRALCHGWINSHESTTAAENQTRQGQGPDEPRRPRFIPDPKGCDNRHSNLAEVCAEIVIKFQSKLTVRAHRLEPITALMLECSTLPIGSQQVRLNVDPLYLPTTLKVATPTGRSEPSRTNSCHSINSSPTYSDSWIPNNTKFIVSKWTAWPIPKPILQHTCKNHPVPSLVWLWYATFESSHMLTREMPDMAMFA